MVQLLGLGHRGHLPLEGAPLAVMVDHLLVIRVPHPMHLQEDWQGQIGLQILLNQEVNPQMVIPQLVEMLMLMITLPPLLYLDNFAGHCLTILITQQYSILETFILIEN